MVEEEFKIIEGFETYSISNLGIVKNNLTNRILKQTINSAGYYKVNLFNDRKSYPHNIHRLVAKAFIPNPENKQQVDHIDNNPLNNNINNLRWVTNQQNSFNTRICKKNTSGCKGVSFEKKSNKWYAEITINGKQQRLGYFDNIEDAIISRYNKAKELYGEYINECEKTQYDIAILIKQKENELKELEELEKELCRIMNK
jgi:hypothetical protein